MKILIIGGTRFLGRHIAETLHKRGHTVSLFNRGREPLNRSPHFEYLTGDRYHDLAILDGRTWDVVIDTCGYEPNAVRLSAEKLKGSVGAYLYVSSGSVYADWEEGEMNENAPVKRLKNEAKAEVEDILKVESPSSSSLLKYYGELKAACEEQLEETLPGRVLHVRSGVIVGPYDYSYRFPYWVNRVAKSGPVLCPDRPEAPIRFLDVRDLADWIVLCAEQSTTGVFNTWGPEAMTFGQFLSTCQLQENDTTDLIWIPEEKLLAEGVQPWVDLPLWLPRDYRPYFKAKDDKARKQGLNYRSMEQTIQDTRQWLADQKPKFNDPEGLPIDREAELLSKLG